MDVFTYKRCRLENCDERIAVCFDEPLSVGPDRDESIRDLLSTVRLFRAAKFELYPVTAFETELQFC